MTSNTVAWLTAKKTIPFEIGPAHLGIPRQNKLLVKSHPIAVNPIDGKMHYLAAYQITYPAVLVREIAREVAAVVPAVTRFKRGVGGRVLVKILLWHDLKSNNLIIVEKAVQLNIFVTSN
ncbi:hypothetical protein BJ878DRAFT_71812 [Calycina marina]|uniref:Alcohol dehydrogenase-like N-terminal domain-containing protein n=1 Tax=Calycina marina TaxID=1763456 RepID=A0A9P7Z2Y6_9HELO|nr:hypothetical protein BJ878DRAFT_71812 [Calycina marina]